MHRVSLAAETAWGRARRASIGRPHRSAVPVDRHAVGASPRSRLGSELRPIPNYFVRIGAAIDGLKLLRLRSTSALLPVHAADLQRDTHDRQRDEPELGET